MFLLAVTALIGMSTTSLTYFWVFNSDAIGTDKGYRRRFFPFVTFFFLNRKLIFWQIHTGPRTAYDEREQQEAREECQLDSASRLQLHSLY